MANTHYINAETVHIHINAYLHPLLGGASWTFSWGLVLGSGLGLGKKKQKKKQEMLNLT